MLGELYPGRNADHVTATCDIIASEELSSRKPSNTAKTHGRIKLGQDLKSRGSSVCSFNCNRQMLINITI